ncbi:MAG TPA: hypothetical protein V6D47_05055 [Oscillatoriaceae cyanobacterium]
MSISAVSVSTARPQAASAKKAPAAAAASSAGDSVKISKAAQTAPQPVKAQSTPKKHNWAMIVGSVGTGVSALAGTFAGMFACGMSDAPVSTFETLKMAGGTGLMFAAVGAAVFFGGAAIVKSLRSK